MKRQFFSALLMGAMVVGATTSLQSCKDYDDDIQNLQQQIDANSKAIKAIEDLIQGGGVIKDVTSTAEGVTITMSNGKEFKISNGTKGADGTSWTIDEATGKWKKDGVLTDYKAIGKDGATPEIGANGNWFINGKDTSVKASGKDAVAPTVEIKGGYWYINGKNTNVKATGENGTGTAGANGMYYVPNPDTKTFWIYGDGTKDPYDSKISYLGSTTVTGNGITGILDTANTKTLTLNGVDGVTGGTVVISLDANLRSLVYMPNLYLDGIETVVYPWLQDTIMNKVADLTGTSRPTMKNNQGQVKGISGLGDWRPNYLANDPKPGTNNKVFNYGPAWGVDYHMNPSNSNTVYKDVKGYNVLEPEVIYYNTRAKASDLGVTSPEKNAAGENLFLNDNGILTAGLQIKNPQLLNEYPTTNTYQKANTIALQVGTKDNSGNDAVITSDYALIQPEKAYLEGLVWGKAPQYARTAPDLNQTAAGRQGDEKGTVKECLNKRVHVWDSPQEALADPDGAALELYYNSATGINIKDYLAIHAMQQNVKAENHPYSVQTWNPAEAAKWGLTFEFNLVEYKVDGNNTIDSRYAKWVDQKNGVLRAYNVSADGKTEDAESKTAVNREPLVQVLVKNADGDVVLDGYILIHITTTPPEEMPNKEIATFPTKKATFDLCNAVDNLETTWSQFSKLVLTDAMENMVKNDFDALYEPDLVSNTAIGTDAGGNKIYAMKQFTSFTEKGAGTAATQLGTVAYYENTEGTTNHVYQWTLSPEEVEALTHDKTLPFTVSRYVRYKAKAGANAKYPYIYIKLTYELNRANITATTFGNKNANYWFAQLDNKEFVDGAILKAENPSTWSSKANIIALDVREPRDGGDIRTFSRGVRSTLLENVELPLRDTHIKEINGVKHQYYKYYFVPKNTTVTAQNGKVYTITAQSSPADTKWNNLFCKYVTAPTTDVHPYNDATLDEVLNKCAINYYAGAFNNVNLYAENNGAYTKIATLNPTTGEISLIKNDQCKDVLNAVGYAEKHANLLTEMNTWVGVVSTSKCELADQVKEGIFRASWQRPINLKATDDQVAIDANTNGNVIYLIDILKMFDWRGETAGYMWGNQTWFWAYYNVKAITVDVDPAHVKTNMHVASGEKYLNEITTDAHLFAYPSMAQAATKYSFNLATYDLASKNQDLIDHMNANKKLFGAIYYENNGDNVTEFYVKVPVTVEYEWGSFQTVVKINIKRTVGH